MLAVGEETIGKEEQVWVETELLGEAAVVGLDLTGTDAQAGVRCPLCHHWLVNRQTSDGPKAVCGCLKHRFF